MTARKRPSGGSATARDRMARMRSRQAKQGMKRVEVTVPETRADEIRQIAAQMRQENTMNPEQLDHLDRLETQAEILGYSSLTDWCLAICERELPANTDSQRANIAKRMRDYCAHQLETPERAFILI